MNKASGPSMNLDLAMGECYFFALRHSHLAIEPRKPRHSEIISTHLILLEV
jgi:hypothetical protein